MANRSSSSGQRRKKSENNASMNEELRKWVEETKAHQKKKAPSARRKKTLSGMCQICGQKDAKVVCIKCGRSVCTSCYFKILSVCKKCVPKDVVEKWEEKQPDWEKILGVEWVD